MRKVREHDAERGYEMTSTELKRFAQTSHIPAGSVTAHIATRHSKTLATAPVGRTRSTTRDAHGRFESTDWMQYVEKSHERLNNTLCGSLIECITKIIARQKNEKRWCNVNETLMDTVHVPAFQEAAAIAARLFSKATKEERQHRIAFATSIGGLQRAVSDVHVDATLHGTVTILLQASGPGLAVPKTGTLADNTNLVDVEQEVGQAVYLAPNVPHVVPHKKRKNKRISLVFFF